MAKGYPTITKSAQTGEIGVNIVAQIVNNELGWLFRRNHNEHDFGIDGYVDIVTPEQAVTGRYLAVQIKCGHSYLSSKDDFGYIYYGETKHLNYLINHPVPVLIILCDPQSGTCYWELFNPAKTEPAKNGWKLSIPSDQILSRNVKNKLEEIAGPSADHLETLEAYWELNKLIGDNTNLVVLVIARDDIEAGNYENVVSFFQRLRATKSFARKLQGKVELRVLGYNNDRRELWEIPKVKNWFKILEPEVKYWFYFLSSSGKVAGLKLLALCLCAIKRKGRRKKLGQEILVEYDRVELFYFLSRNYEWLNEIAEWTHLPLEEIKRISFEVVIGMGFEEIPR
ncbi:MAG: DUF4365 and DUF1817 domain-containing protein [Anaerolineae bacterium]|nr:DUF4365 and DUF1817 domain-containing protein [Anaerolineae bacterium]